MVLIEELLDHRTKRSEAGVWGAVEAMGRSSRLRLAGVRLPGGAGESGGSGGRGGTPVGSGWPAGAEMADCNA